MGVVARVEVGDGVKVVDSKGDTVLDFKGKEKDPIRKTKELQAELDKAVDPREGQRAIVHVHDDGEVSVMLMTNPIDLDGKLRKPDKDWHHRGLQDDLPIVVPFLDIMAESAAGATTMRFNVIVPLLDALAVPRA